ncbi:DUF4184 family protein [Microbacterium terricola]|uniref:Cell wall anchor protein n=1 Tax=Microbacterium terricola TaxID=344163 RepID=A0ABM8DXH9_9MICO|nr:DUF4184 family protein [Microbacterium terricola]UYK38992.1 DUF4184 family protein [Microbacterium terricola]BDV30302.1 hypothetical protein Microterr_09620 [Microbacterium terricola]
MPFTPSHAVVALPFVRTPLVPAAIAVGAMAPDLPLFVRDSPLTYQVTHTNIAVAVLVSLALLLVWWALLRPAVRELSPRWLAARLPGEWDATGREIVATVRAPRPGARRAVWRSGGVLAILLALSLVLGVVSHIAWDAFTHDGRWGVSLFPALGEYWGPLLGYKWLQYGSGVIGVVILTVSAALWMRGRDAATPVDRVLPAAIRVGWWISLPIVLVAGWLIGLAVYGPLTAEWTPAHLAYRVLPPASAAWGVLTLGLCVAVQVLRRRRPAGA